MSKVEVLRADGAEVTPGIFQLSGPATEQANSRAAEKYLQILVRNRVLIAVVLAGSLILGLTATLLMTPRYSAAAMIEIARETGRILNVEGVEREAGAADQEFYQTQYGLLESQTLAERVVRDLRLADDPKFFTAFGTLPDNPNYDLVQTRFAARGRDTRAEDAADILLSTLDVSPVRGSSLVEVVFTTPDPELSSRLANGWVRNFISINLERRFEATSYARTFLEQRLAELRGRLETTERDLVNYAEQQEVINVPVTGDDGASSGAERPIAAETLSLLNQSLAQATSERVRAQSRLQDGVAEEALANVGISNLRAERAEVAAEHARLLVQFEPGYPQVLQLASQLEQLDQSIRGEEARVRSALQSRYREAVQRESGLRSQVNSAKNALLDQRQRSIQYNIFLRDVDTNRALYDGLLQRYKEIGVAGGIGVNNISIIDDAEVPENPSSPNLVLNLLIAAVLGTIGGIGVAVARDHLSDTVDSPAEIETKLGAPMVGLIPEVTDLNVIEELSDRKTELVEAVMTIRTNLAMATAHGFPRSLSVTSTRPSEGKSSTAFSLAVTVGRTGKRAVLVDADMRKPSLHKMLEKTNDAGLSSYLSGQKELAVLVQPTGFESLDCILAGPLPPNAAELLSSGKFRELIDELLTRYDHVVIDGPPVLGLADAPLIGGQVEGVIYVVEASGMRAGAIRIALDRLRMTGAKIFGIVMSKYGAKNGYGYGYGYSYEYSYGRQSTS